MPGNNKTTKGTLRKINMASASLNLPPTMSVIWTLSILGDLAALAVAEVAEAAAAVGGAAAAVVGPAVAEVTLLIMMVAQTDKPMTN